MSIVRREHESENAGTAFTFLKPMPAVQSTRIETGLPALAEDEVASALFPPRDREGETPRAAGLSLGAYRIIEQIGRGGMGAVFRAVDARLDRIVALKVLSPELSRDRSAVQRFQNEARAAAKLDHDNIAQVHDVGQDHGLYYIAFEYVGGTNLRDVLNRHRGPFSTTVAVSITLQIADALRQTAAAEVVHRDIKPSNIIISPSGRAKLVDWGLARQNSLELSQELTQTGTTLGTFDYISPEQAVDPRNVDIRSDIYSLGCTLFHMLTGEPPYPRGSMFQKVLDHHRPEPPDVTQRNPDVSPELSRIVRRMMASDPAQRYLTPEAVIHDLSIVANQMGMATSDSAGLLIGPIASDEEETSPRAGWGWLGAFLALIGLVWYLDRPRTNTDLADSVNRPAITAPETSLPTETPSSNPGNASSKAAPANRSAPPAPDSASGAPTQRRGIGDGVTLGPHALDMGTRGALASAATSSLLSPPKSVAQPPVSERPPVGQKFSVRSSTSMTPKWYQSLELACTEAMDKDIIELHFNGRESFDDPIKINGKRLMIRAAPSYRPVLAFGLSPIEARGGSQRFPRMITVSGTGGELELSNVDLVLSIPPESLTDRWALIAVSPGQRVTLQGVSVTVENPSSLPATVFEIGPFGVSNMAGPQSDADAPRAVLSVNSSVVRGRANFLWHESSDPASLDVRQSALALNGVFYWRSATDSLGDFSSQQTNRNEIALDHVTGVFENGLLRIDLGDQGETRPIEVSCRDSIIAVTESRAPLVSMSGHGDVETFTELLDWHSSFSYFDVDSAFWEVKAKNLLEPVEKTWQFPEWKTRWNADLDVLVSAPLFDRLSLTARRDYTTVETDDFSLQQNGVTSNPPVGGDSRHKNAGVDLTLPPLPRQLPLSERRESAVRNSLMFPN